MRGCSGEGEGAGLRRLRVRGKASGEIDGDNVPFLTGVLTVAALTEPCVGGRAMKERKMARVGDGSALISGLEGRTFASSPTGSALVQVNRHGVAKGVRNSLAPLRSSENHREHTPQPDLSRQRTMAVGQGGAGTFLVPQDGALHRQDVCVGPQLCTQ